MARWRHSGTSKSTAMPISCLLSWIHTGWESVATSRALVYLQSATTAKQTHMDPPGPCVIFQFKVKEIKVMDLECRWAPLSIRPPTRWGVCTLTRLSIRVKLWSEGVGHKSVFPRPLLQREVSNYRSSQAFTRRVFAGGVSGVGLTDPALLFVAEDSQCLTKGIPLPDKNSLSVHNCWT